MAGVSASISAAGLGRWKTERRGHVDCLSVDELSRQNKIPILRLYKNGLGSVIATLKTGYSTDAVNFHSAKSRFH